MAHLPPPLLLPRYGQSSLADLAGSLFDALGVPGFSNPLAIEPLQRVCLLLIDGLGWELLADNADTAPFLSSQLSGARQLTAGCPATTAVSLTSLGTGLPPGQHGILGYTMGVPGYERPLNMLGWTFSGPGPRPDLREELPPERLQPHETAFQQAASHGVAVTMVAPSIQDGSGLTRAAFRGSRHRSSGSIFGILEAETLHALQDGDRSFVYAYHGDLDMAGHMQGAASDAWRVQLSVLDRFASLLAERLPAGAALAITGDHGMVDLDERLDVAEAPELLDGVRFLAGEARARHVYTQPAATEDVLATWRTRLQDRMWVLSRDEAIEAGLFGPVEERVRQHIGDVLALARTPFGLVQRAFDPLEASFVGHHGSLTPRELLVPLILLPGG